MIETLQTQFEALKRDILELKTAQKKPSLLQTYHQTGTMAAGFYTAGIWSWTIHYDNDGSMMPPITSLTSYQPYNAYLKPYNPSTNTQKIYFYPPNGEASTTQSSYYNAATIIAASSKKILSITQDQTPIQYEWTQVRDFYPADMGTTPGYCLQNSRLGFHIYSGTYMTARADMEAQQANGTLHSGTPPDYIAVPVYYANYNITPAGHVAVWDHGTVWSDGVAFPSIDSVTNSYVGWGELCDGARVVQHV